VTYLDAASGEPLHPAARQTLLAALDEGWADPTRLYREARRARLLLDNAREVVASLLPARPDEVVFTSSGTQALHLGVLGTLLLAALAGLTTGGPPEDPSQALMPATGPAHPIVGEVGRSAVVTLLVLVAGAVAAPIVEEIFFRGALYGHLRQALRGTGAALATLLAAIVSAFIFAAIHPQGWIAVPALMSLAIGFALVREWRGSVIAPVVMHAINNGIVLTGLTLMLA